MSTVISKDGTTIAYERSGSGPALVLVNGALDYRAVSANGKLADRLADRFNVYRYDRRGRGESGDRLPYALEREVEDIEALIREAGEPAFLYGESSGACLVFEAALRLGERVRKIALYEPPYNSEESSRQRWRQYRKELEEALAAGPKGEALGLFMKLVGATDEDVAQVRQTPMWDPMEAVEQTLAYDAEIMGEEAELPVEQAAELETPALVLNGGASFPFMEATARSLAQAMPHGRHRILEGQTHEVSAEALAPALAEFFSE